ncbi:hypothetical protein [Streptomyces sp. NPDC006610]|uniref:hypothetical protein n=1 Tax=Streptomyces sp. NPDC006610 TaxID=3154584 RepID=UPI0033BC3EDA
MDLDQEDHPLNKLGRPRFVVQEFGPRNFAVYDIVSGFNYDLRFTRKAAQKAADRRNARAATA